MDKFLNLVVSGAVSGAIYSLIASGLVLSYSASGIFNLGYGAIAFAAAFLYYELHIGWGWAVLPAALFTVLVFAPALGWVLHATIFRRLSRARDEAKIVGTVGILVALPALMRWFFEVLVNVVHWDLPLGSNVFAVPGIGPTPKETWNPVGRVTIDSNQVVVFAGAVVVALGLWIILRRSRMGLQFRAVVDGHELAGMRGIDPDRVTAVSWVLGTTIAALAGVIAAPVFNSLQASTYTLAMFAAVAAAVIGGLRSMPGAFAGGLALGVLQNLVAGYATFASDIRGFSASVPFVVVLVGLLVMARMKGRQVATVTRERVVHDLPLVRAGRRALVGWLVGAASVVAYLFVAGPFWLGLTTRGLALGVVFLSFVLVTGQGGMVNLAPAALVTAAGLTTGLLYQHYGLPLQGAALGGIAVAVLLGLVVALPSLRLGGLPLALATLALAFMGDNVLFSWNWFRNGQAGWDIPRLTIGPFDLADERTFALVVLAIMAAVILVIHNVSKSASGRAMVAVRSSEAAAEASGLSAARTKLLIFSLAAAVAGLGGFLLASFDRHAVNEAYPAALGLTWLAVVVLFGVRRPEGAVLAGLAASLFPALISEGFHWPDPMPSWLGWDGTKVAWVPNALFGMGAIQLAKDPDGLLSLFGRRRSRRSPAFPRPESPLAVSEREPQTDAPSASAEPVGDGEPVLALRDASAGYGATEVLFGVDLELRPGRITALVGPNGAGKSTISAVLAGTLPLVAGSLHLSDADITAEPAHRRARRGLTVSPESRGIFPELTVDDNLAVRLPGRRQRVEVYNRFPQLAARRDLPAGRLSGGEQQILSLASVVVSPPTVFVADEPSLGLAPLVVAEIKRLVVELRDADVAVLLIEEQANAILDVADDVAVLDLGRVTRRGPVAEVSAEELSCAYLGLDRSDSDAVAGQPKGVTL